MRVAIVHPWFLAMGGAEQTVGVIAEMYPQADIFTLFYDKNGLPPQLIGRRIIASWWNFLPGKYRFYRYMLPFYPAIFEAIDLRGYDLVVSSDSCVIKGVLPDEHTTHVCYCHSPMRCLYDQYWDYVYSLPAFVRPIYRHFVRHLRVWDYVSAHRVTGLAANAQFIADRIHSYYGLPSRVVYPPVQTKQGYLDPNTEDYYLTVGRMVRSKRLDVLIHACNLLNRRLVIVGSGREYKALRKIAGPTIEFTRRISDEKLASLYSRCRALLFAAKEDFGIVPIEAQAHGRPVIAYGEGGVIETVLDGKTGLFFKDQSPESLAEAILRFEQEGVSFSPAEIRDHALTFDTSQFKRGLSDFIDLCMSAKSHGKDWFHFQEDNADALRIHLLHINKEIVARKAQG
jgi:glycosyltransferase involved in cell wall biosynthesis